VTDCHSKVFEPDPLLRALLKSDYKFCKSSKASHVECSLSAYSLLLRLPPDEINPSSLDSSLLIHVLWHHPHVDFPIASASLVRGELNLDLRFEHIAVMHFVPPVSTIVPATRNLVSNDDLVVVAHDKLLRVVLSKRVLCLVALVLV
jgi:hypothetical protein